MANRRLSMRKIKEVLRLRWELGLGRRQTGRICSISHNTVAEYEQRALDGRAVLALYRSIWTIRP